AHGLRFVLVNLQRAHDLAHGGGVSEAFADAGEKVVGTRHAAYRLHPTTFSWWGDASCGRQPSARRRAATAASANPNSVVVTGSGTRVAWMLSTPSCAMMAGTGWKGFGKFGMSLWYSRTAVVLDSAAATDPSAAVRWDGPTRNWILVQPLPAGRYAASEKAMFSGGPVVGSSNPKRRYRSVGPKLITSMVIAVIPAAR